MLTGMSKYVWIIGLGGGIGSICRYLLQAWVVRHYPHPFPFGTLAANLLGCFGIGIVFALAEKRMLLSPEWRFFLTTGFCGGFTTFSTFSYEVLALLTRG